MTNERHASTAPATAPRVAADVASELVVLTFDEWSSIRTSLRGLVAAELREGRAIEFDTESAETAEAVHRRWHANVRSSLGAAAAHDRVTISIEVRPDATDAELLIAARRAARQITETEREPIGG